MEPASTELRSRDGGCRNRNFTHYFTPQQVSRAYRLSADVMADLLHEGARARGIAVSGGALGCSAISM